MTNENKEHTLIGSLRKTLGHISYNSPALTLTLKCRNHVLSTTNNKSNIYGFIGFNILQGFFPSRAKIGCGCLLSHIKHDNSDIDYPKIINPVEMNLNDIVVFSVDCPTFALTVHVDFYPN